MTLGEKGPCISTKYDNDQDGNKNCDGETTVMHPSRGRIYVDKQQGILHSVVEVKLWSEVFYVGPQVQLPRYEGDGYEELYSKPRGNVSPVPLGFHVACIRWRSERETKGRETEGHSPAGPK
jgi:hypothetical protein